MNSYQTQPLTVNQVYKGLMTLIPHYPEAGHNGKTLAAISKDYAEDLNDEQVTSRQFHEAIKIVRKTSKWFPKLADILDAVRQHREKPRQQAGNHVQIEEYSSRHDLTPEEQAINRRRGFLIRARLVDRVITQLELEEEMELLRIRVFRNRMEK